MFAYHVRLAQRSLRKSPVLTALVVGLIGLGVGMSMITLTIYTAMSGDPIPAKSERLFNVQIDSWSKGESWDDRKPDAAPAQLTHRDALALRQLPGLKERAAMFKGVFTVVPDSEELKPFLTGSRMTDTDFFTMFDVPFKYGGPWSRQIDETAERVVILSRETNEKAFGGSDSVGQSVTLGRHQYEVVGVLDDWNPTPTFYDVNNGAFDPPADLFMPFSTLQFGEMDRAGNTNCWKVEDSDTWEDFLNSECVWIQFWGMVDKPSDIAEFQGNLDAYAVGQKELGRFERPLNNPIMNVKQWLAHSEVVSEDNAVLVGLAFLFLAVCLFNAVGILLARFVGKAPVIGVRRALGASKGAIFRQHLVEVSMIGVLGGLLGLALSALGLFGVKKLYLGYDQLVHLDVSLMMTAIAIAVGAAILAGLYPTWRVCQVAPATYLKTQ